MLMLDVGIWHTAPHRLLSGVYRDIVRCTGVQDVGFTWNPAGPFWLRAGRVPPMLEMGLGFRALGFPRSCEGS